MVFAYISVLLFLISILFHIYTLILWRRYWGQACLIYAIGQPLIHICILTFATIVSATNSCARLDSLRNQEVKEWVNPLNEIVALKSISEDVDAELIDTRYKNSTNIEL